jgi:hypothetical protein
MVLSLVRALPTSAARQVCRDRLLGFDIGVTEKLGRGGPMKYLILIYRNPASREIWDGMSDAERAEGFTAYAALNEELAAAGELIVSEALADQSLAKRVTVRDGQIMTTDGPFAEAKEQLAGIYLVECDSIDRAIEIAAQVPGAEYLEVEVWPVLHLGEIGQ